MLLEDAIKSFFRITFEDAFSGLIPLTQKMLLKRPFEIFKTHLNACYNIFLENVVKIWFEYVLADSN